MKRSATLGCSAALALVAVAPLGGCRGDRSDKPPRQFFPDMDDQPRLKPQSETEFFVNGRTMRQPPAHTVPFGTSEVLSDADWAAGAMRARANFLRADYEVFEGTDDMLNPLTEFPVPVTMELLERGRERFNIYCSVCHGYNGEGAGNDPNLGGMVGRRWSIPVPSFHNPLYLEGGERGAVGHIFNVARNGLVNNGVQTMPGYGHALDAHDAWAVVAYVRALQRSWLGELDDVPEAQRSQLGPAPQPTEEPAGEQPAPATEGEQ
jgi:mono/diheme cytochrome c family protein